MRACGIEIKSNEIILCLMNKDEGLFDLPDCRQSRFQLTRDQDAEQLRKFQFTLNKLFDDYQVEQLVIKERPQRGKFAGSAVGFKIEAALQLMPGRDVYIMSSTEQKERLKRNPVQIDFADTGLKKFQEQAFLIAYAFLSAPANSSTQSD